MHGVGHYWRRNSQGSSQWPTSREDIFVKGARERTLEASVLVCLDIFLSTCTSFEQVALLKDFLFRCLIVSDRLAGIECGRPSYSREEESVFLVFRL